MLRPGSGPQQPSQQVPQQQQVAAAAGASVSAALALLNDHQQNSLQPWVPASQAQVPLQQRLRPILPPAQGHNMSPIMPSRQAAALAQSNRPLTRSSLDVDASILCPHQLTSMAATVLWDMSRDTGSRMLIDRANPEPGGQRVLIQGPPDVRERAKLHFRAWLSVQTGDQAPDIGMPLDFPPGMPPGPYFQLGGLPLGMPPGFPPPLGAPANFAPGMNVPDAFPPGMAAPPNPGPLPAGFPPVDFPPAGDAWTDSDRCFDYANAVRASPISGLPPGDGMMPIGPVTGDPYVIDLESDDEPAVVAPLGVLVPEGFGVTWDEL